LAQRSNAIGNNGEYPNSLLDCQCKKSKYENCGRVDHAMPSRRSALITFGYCGSGNTREQSKPKWGTAPFLRVFQIGRTQKSYGTRLRALQVNKSVNNDLCDTNLMPVLKIPRLKMKNVASLTLVMLLLAACGGVEVKYNIINTYYDGGTNDNDDNSGADADPDDDISPASDPDDDESSDPVTGGDDDDITTDDDGLIRLTTNQIYEVVTLIKALGVNYEDSGFSTVRITDGPYAGLEIQKQPSTKDGDLVSIKFVNAGQATKIGYASDDIHTILAAFVNTIGSQPSQPQVTNETINDQTVRIVQQYSKEKDAFSLNTSSLQILLQSGETLSSTAGTATDGSDLGRYRV